LNGWLSSHTYWEQSEMNGVDRGASIDLDRKLTPRFSIFGNGSLQYFAKINEIRAGDTVTQNASGQPVVTPGQIVEGNAPDVNIEQGVGGFRFALTPLTELELSGGPYSVSYGESPASNEEIRDRDGWFAGLSLDHQLTALDKLSFNLSTSNNDQDDIVSGTTLVVSGSELVANPTTFPLEVAEIDTGKSRSEQQSVTVGWQRLWSPVWRTNLAVGVRRLHTEVTGATRGATQVIVPPVCIPLPPGPPLCFPGDTPEESTAFTQNDFDDTGPGIVGELQVTRTFARSALSFGYSRETRSTSSAVTSDVNVDTFSFQYSHQLAERVRLGLFGNYELYGTANDNPSLVGAEYVEGSLDPLDPDSTPLYTCPSGKLIETGSGRTRIGQCETSQSNALHSQLLVLSARLDWQLRKRLGTFAVFRYYDRSGDEELFGNDYDKFNFGVGFRYNYDLDL